MKAALYARSGIDQGDNGIEAQLKQLRKWCKSHHLEVHREYTDIGTGPALSDRTAWNELIADGMEGKFDAVLVTSPDRISRSAQEINDILRTREDLGIMFAS